MLDLPKIKNIVKSDKAQEDHRLLLLSPSLQGDAYTVRAMGFDDTSPIHILSVSFVLDLFALK